MNYTHRNGETDAPTVDGAYWFDGFRTQPSGNRIHVMDILKRIDGVIERHDAPASWDGQWWGPIVAPWEVAA